MSTLKQAMGTARRIDVGKNLRIQAPRTGRQVKRETHTAPAPALGKGGYAEARAGAPKDHEIERYARCAKHTAQVTIGA